MKRYIYIFINITPDILACYNTLAMQRDTVPSARFVCKSSGYIVQQQSINCVDFFNDSPFIFMYMYIINKYRLSRIIYLHGIHFFFINFFFLLFNPNKAFVLHNRVLAVDGLSSNHLLHTKTIDLRNPHVAG